MSTKDPLATLRAMGVTMSEVKPIALPSRAAKRSKATPKKVVAAVRSALQDYRGVSAATIAAVLVPELADLCEGITGRIWSYPSDPDDFSRCRRIVALIPNGVARMGELAETFHHSRAWSRLAAAWPELEALFVEESGLGWAGTNRMYARMQELTAMSDPIRISQWYLRPPKSISRSRAPAAAWNCVAGTVFGHPKATDGKRVTTSPIVRVEGRCFWTASGNAYVLEGVPLPKHLTFLKTLGREYESTQPLAFVGGRP